MEIHTESKATAKSLQEKFKEAGEDAHKDEIKACKDMTKEIEEAIAWYLGKDDKRQGIVRNPEPTVTTRIFTAYRYVGSRKTGITETETKLMEHARKQLDSTLSKTNAFFEDKWKPFKEKMEAQPPQVFKEVKTFALDVN